MTQSPDIGQNLDVGISDFWISGQFLIKENYHNYRTCNDIDMKFDKKTKQSQKNDGDFSLVNCDVIVIFPFYGQFGAIRKSDSERIVCKTYILIKSNLSSYKNLKQN